ncbi:hypothetical protein NON27_25735, partial [Vibrio parahaemolyticus]|nr:hypothetical protein [Vibrio parahaemolyticus]
TRCAIHLGQEPKTKDLGIKHLRWDFIKGVLRTEKYNTKERALNSNKTQFFYKKKLPGHKKRPQN